MPEHDDDAPQIDPQIDPEIDPEIDAEVSELLRSLREEGGVPDEVAARLDARLADLTADGSRDRRTPWVRRHAGRLLVAAAVVGVVGVGGTVVRSSLTSGVSGSGSSSSTDAAAGSARPDQRLPELPLPALTSTRFASQVRALLERSDLSAGGEAAATACGAPPAAPGVRRRAIALDGRPAVLDVYPARRGTVLVRAVGCGGGRVLATARVPRG